MNGSDPEECAYLSSEPSPGACVAYPAAPAAVRVQRYTILGRWVSKKNEKQILRRGRYGPRFVGSSHLYRRWEREAVLQLRAQRMSFLTITGPVRVSLTIYLAAKQRRPDRDNARAGPFDALQKAGIIRNDSQIQEDPLAFARDPERPRVEVLVEELQ